MVSIVTKTPLGNFEISEEDGYISSCLLTKKKASLKNTSKLLTKAVKQLEEYFKNKRTDFDLPLKAQGTEFQQKVWKRLSKIPYGKTISYKELAESIKHPGAYRAVGTANGKNPLCIIVPCHRVINESGKLGGYSAGGLKNKETLLELESI